MVEKTWFTRESFFIGQDTKIEEIRERRTVERRCFIINDMSQKCEKVDKTFQEKEEELKEFYIDYLEKELHIGAWKIIFSEFIFLDTIKLSRFC